MSIPCSEHDSRLINLTYYLFNCSNVTHVSLIGSYLSELPDLYNNTRVFSLDLDYNQIKSMNRNYSTIEYLYLASNHISILHQTNLYYPKLIFLDLSYNRIDYIEENFFSIKQFPRLKVLKLIKSLTHVNIQFIHQKSISFSSLEYLDEIFMDENNFEQFSCIKTKTNVQWTLPKNLKKLSLRKNKLITLDQTCLKQIVNIAELDLHLNYLQNLPYLNLSLPYLSKVHLDFNQFTQIPLDFLHSCRQLTELDLSGNHLKLQSINTKERYALPSTLKALYLNVISSDLTCSLLENAHQLKQLHLAQLISTQLHHCTFRNLPKLQTLNLYGHHLKVFKEEVFRPLLVNNQLEILDITSRSLPCESCSLRWLIQFLKHHNKTQVTCLNHRKKEILLNTLDLSPCYSLRRFSTWIFSTVISISLLLFIILIIVAYRHRKLSLSKISSAYHMIPLQSYHRCYDYSNDDTTNDNVILVT